MAISSHLLERAYQLINANQMQNAELVLDAVVRVDPQNIEAWIAYMEIHRDRNDLEWLKDRILRTREISDQDKSELLQYHAVLIEHLKMIENGTAKTGTNYNLNFKQPKETASKTDNISFELLDVFDYPLVKNEPVLKIKKRPNRRRPWGGINLLSPVNQGIALFFIFFAAVRLLVSGYLLGYGLLALFLAGSFYWLSNYKHPKSINLNDPARVYFLDSKDKVAITEKKIVDVKKKPKKKSRVKILS